MAQTLFIGGLYILGFAFGLLFRKRIPFAFISLTGFLWGCMLYVAEAMLLIGLRIPYTLMNMAIFSGVILIGLGVVNYRLGNWRLAKSDVAWLAGSLLVFSVSSALVTQFNPTVVTADSLTQIMVGREIAFDGFSTGVIDNLSLMGPFILVLHSASVLIGSEYLYTLIPSFSLSLFMVFVYITYRSIRRISPGRLVALALALLAGMVLFSSDFLIYQSFYIHNDLATAAYLFTAVGVCWLAVIEENNAWLAFAVPALICFSLLRAETVIFAVFIFFLVNSLANLSGRARWLFTLPFVGIMLAWYIIFYFNFLRDSFMLNPARVLILMALLVGLGLYVFVLGNHKLEQFIHTNLLYVVGGGALLLLSGLLLINPGNVMTGLVVTVQNMLVYGQWGVIWYVVLAGLILAFTQPRFKDEGFFVLIIAVNFLILIALGWLRTNVYHLGREDSGNRMLTYVLPLAVYYLVLKYTPGFMERISGLKSLFSEIKSPGTQRSDETTAK
jgi:hypothetical protein